MKVEIEENTIEIINSRLIKDMINENQGGSSL